MERGKEVRRGRVRDEEGKVGEERRREDEEAVK